MIKQPPSRTRQHHGAHGWGEVIAGGDVELAVGAGRVVATVFVVMNKAWAMTSVRCLQASALNTDTSSRAQRHPERLKIHSPCSQRQTSGIGGRNLGYRIR